MVEPAGRWRPSTRRPTLLRELAEAGLAGKRADAAMAAGGCLRRQCLSSRHRGQILVLLPGYASIIRAATSLQIVGVSAMRAALSLTTSPTSRVSLVIGIFSGVVAAGVAWSDGPLHAVTVGLAFSLLVYGTAAAGRPSGRKPVGAQSEAIRHQAGGWNHPRCMGCAHRRIPGSHPRRPSVLRVPARVVRQNPRFSNRSEACPPNQADQSRGAG